MSRLQHRIRILAAATAMFGTGLPPILGAGRPPAAAQAAASMRESEPGGELPPLALPDLQGVAHSLSEWQGKVILLNFWATRCRPCQTEVPRFIRYQAQYGASGLQIVGVGLDHPDEIRNFVRTFGIGYPILVAEPESHPDLLSHWGDPRQLLPYSVVIGRDGRRHFRRIGLIDDEIFADQILPLLTPAAPGD